jgi:SSS family solute:Na+ symporter
MDPSLWLDVAVFVGFFVLVIGVGIGMSRDEQDTSEDYFLAGRGLSWWLIGFSLIAANISSEQFIGMSGQAAMYVGLAIASYEWMAAVTLVVVAFFFLPKFLRAGIYTIPEFLEYRFTRGARSLMSLLMVLICVLVSFTAVIYSGALTADVLFGDAPLIGNFHINLVSASWIIGVLSAIYVVAGGLKACAWADLIQGASLILGGAIVTYLAFQALGNAEPQAIGLAAEQASSGALERFTELNSHKLHMALPATDLILPVTALMLGLWIPNFYYWGLNQYITQRTLGAQSVAAGQRGVVFAAALKLIIPFIIVIPGIIAFNLFAGDMRDRAAPENQPVLDRLAASQSDPSASKTAFVFDADFAALYTDIAKQMLAFNRLVAGIEAAPPAETPAALAAENSATLKRIGELNRERPGDQQIAVQSTVIGYKHDAAFPLLMKNLVFNHPGIRGFVVAALYGAVISSLAAVLNAASTLFTMDLYRPYLNPNASQSNLVLTGRICVVLFTIIGCWLAPQLNKPEFKGIFTYIQEFQGFFSPGVLAVFLFGLFVHRAPRICGLLGLLVSPPVYAFLKWGLPRMGYGEIAFLDRMAITFGVDLVVLAALTLLAPLPQPVVLPEQTKIAIDHSTGAKFWGAIVVLATLALYWKFW